VDRDRAHAAGCEHRDPGAVRRTDRLAGQCPPGYIKAATSRRPAGQGLDADAARHARDAERLVIGRGRWPRPSEAVRRRAASPRPRRRTGHRELGRIGRSRPTVEVPPARRGVPFELGIAQQQPRRACHGSVRAAQRGFAPAAARGWSSAGPRPGAARPRESSREVTVELGKVEQGVQRCPGASAESARNRS
jgi:hypothetical protein